MTVSSNTLNFRAILDYLNLTTLNMALAMLCVVVFFTNLDIYIYMNNIILIPPKYFMLSIGLLSLPLIWQLFSRRKLLLANKLFIFVFTLFVIYFVFLIVYFNDQNYILFREQVTGLAFLTICYILFQERKALLVARRAMLVCVILAILIDLLEVIIPGLFSINPGRSAGLYMNSNINAYALIAGLILTVGILPPRFRIAYLIAVSAGVFSTLSRSGLVILVLVSFFLFLQGLFYAKWKKIDALMNLLLVICLVVFFSYSYNKVPQYSVMVNNQFGSLVKYASDKIALANKDNDIGKLSENNTTKNSVDVKYAKGNMALVESEPTNKNVTIESVKVINEELGSKDSAIARDWLLKHSYEVYLQSPLWGAGMAQAWELSTHNVYLLLAIAYGFVGWFIMPIFALIIYLTGERRLSFIMAIYLLSVGMFSHNVLVDRTILLPLALVAAITSKELCARKKIIHVITDLSVGGAEMMLYKLLSRMKHSAVKNEVISLTDIGVVGKKIQELGVPVRSLGMRKRVPNPVALLKLTYWFMQDPPRYVQTWMYHADFLGGLAAKMAGNIPVIWGIRQSYFDPSSSKKTTILIAKICAWLSRIIPVRIICCSESSHQVHKQMGYSSKKMIVISNGFDLSAFKPDPSARLAVRKELGLSEETLIIGLIGRYDPVKDHSNFIHAAEHLSNIVPEVHFLLCGDGINWSNQDLVKCIKSTNIVDQFHLLGRRDDISKITAALDIACNTSYSEGFPNVIGEAMACGVPCVVTDVGDSAFIVGNTGKVVPPRNPEALVDAWLELINMGPEGRRQLGESARRRIQDNFNIDLIAKKYEKIYRGERVRCAV